MCPSSAGAGETVSAVVADVSRESLVPDLQLVADLVVANRILFDQSVVDAFGHVSVRHDKQPDRFLLARSMAPALVTSADILEFDLEGNPVGSDNRPVYLERFIHSEIYRARPDVNAVVHAHSLAVIPFGMVQGLSLRAVWHMSGFLGTATPVFEIRDHAGDGSNLLIRDGALGSALARTLGANAAVLMRGHGFTVAGTSLRQAVYRAVYTEVNAKLQLQMVPLGPVNYLTQAEARTTSASADTQIGRAWDLWKMRIEGKL
jgi:HCOMODA/2-hydroxy-3-carboxy-muconic semialdehyde decarboxylase